MPVRLAREERRATITADPGLPADPARRRLSQESSPRQSSPQQSSLRVAARAAPSPTVGRIRDLFEFAAAGGALKDAHELVADLSQLHLDPAAHREIRRRLVAEKDAFEPSAFARIAGFERGLHPLSRFSAPRVVSDDKHASYRFVDLTKIDFGSFIHVNQTGLSNCFAMVVQRSLTRFAPDFVRQSFVISEDGRSLSGRFFVEDRKTGRMKETRVTVPAAIPVGKDGKPLYGGDMKHAWVSLWVEMYAKLRGDYDAVARGGLSANAFKAMTGLPAQWLWMNRPGVLYQQMRAALGRGDLVFSGTRGTDPTRYGESKQVAGSTSEFDRRRLIAGHDYAVLAVFETNGTRYVHLSNPWGWFGPRNADGSSGHPSGEGVITWDDFLTFFDQTSVGHLSKLRR